MDLIPVLKYLGVALGLGLLVGLQRESVKSRIAGFRTFPLITILGTVCSLLARAFGGWIVAAGSLALAAVIFCSMKAEQKGRPPDPGITTEVAMLLMYGVGAYIVIGHLAIAIAIGGSVAVLLQFKGELHGIAARLGDEDLKAIMQFVLISLVILPVLPDKTYGPYAVLNPQQIWWMVVLVVGIGLGGYIVYKFFGERAGIMLGGILGGMVSSTATTVSYAKRTKAAPKSSDPAAIVIMFASAVVFGRLVVLVAAVSPGFLPEAGPPMLAMLVLLAALSGALWLWKRQDHDHTAEHANPSELRFGLVFGLFYAAALFAVAAAKEHFGNRGLYTVAVLAGLTDVDAITLSTCQMVNSKRLDPDTGWKIMLVSSLSNLGFKAFIIAAFGHRQLLMKIAAPYALAFIGGILILLLWP